MRLQAAPKDRVEAYHYKILVELRTLSAQKAGITEAALPDAISLGGVVRWLFGLLEDTKSFHACTISTAHLVKVVHYYDPCAPEVGVRATILDAGASGEKLTERQLYFWLVAMFADANPEELLSALHEFAEVASSPWLRAVPSRQYLDRVKAIEEKTGLALAIHPGSKEVHIEAARGRPPHCHPNAAS